MASDHDVQANTSAVYAGGDITEDDNLINAGAVFFVDAVVHIAGQFVNYDFFQIGAGSEGRVGSLYDASAGGTGPYVAPSFAGVQIDAGGALTVDGALTIIPGATFNNDGDLTVHGGGKIWGDLSGAGSFDLDGGLLLLETAVTLEIANFSVIGAGTTVAMLDNVSYGGNFTLGAATRVNIPSYFELTLTGTASIAGLIDAGGLVIAGGTTTLEPGGAIHAEGFVVSGATTHLEIDETFDYAAGFVLIDGAAMTIESASDVFVSRGSAISNTPTILYNATVDGLGRIATVGATLVSSLTLGGSTLWEDEGAVTQGGDNVAFTDNARMLITTGSTYNITDDSDIATTNLAWFSNRGLFEKTGGPGISDIAPRVINDGAIELSSGILDFEGVVKGTGTATIAGSAILEFDNLVTLTQTIDFTGSGGRLILDAPDEFAASISGFDTVGSNDTIAVAGGWFFLGFTENPAHTQGTLDFVGFKTIMGVILQGDYAASDFHTIVSVGANHITYG
jgi:hypothetical protein